MILLKMDFKHCRVHHEARICSKGVNQRERRRVRKETVSDRGDRRSGWVTCGGMKEETEVSGEEMCEERGS